MELFSLLFLRQIDTLTREKSLSENALAFHDSGFYSESRIKSWVADPSLLQWSAFSKWLNIVEIRKQTRCHKNCLSTFLFLQLSIFSVFACERQLCIDGFLHIPSFPHQVKLKYLIIWQVILLSFYFHENCINNSHVKINMSMVYSNCNLM